MGYFVSMMGYFVVWWPILGYLAFQVFTGDLGFLERDLRFLPLKEVAYGCCKDGFGGSLVDSGLLNGGCRAAFDRDLGLLKTRLKAPVKDLKRGFGFPFLLEAFRFAFHFKGIRSSYKVGLGLI